MILGAFSISLAVQDIAVSRAFYEKIGFEVTGGVEVENWLILRNGESTVGLFQGMFPNNMLTFNPGLRGSDMERLTEFDDVRNIAESLREQGIEVSEIDSESGPANITITDPDGNPILIDQFW